MRLANKRPPKRRRSQSRLGITEVAALAPRLSLLPVQINWQVKVWRLPAAIFAGLLCYALFYCFTDEQFYIFGAAISGNSRLSAQRIYDQAGIEGQSIFFLNPEEVRKRVEGLPNIKASSVSLQLPATVEIQVQEREPSFGWQVGQKTYWVDEEGMVMEPAGPPPIPTTALSILWPEMRSARSTEATMASVASVTLTIMPRRMPRDGTTPTPTMRRLSPSSSSPTSVQVFVVPTSMPAIVRCANTVLSPKLSYATGSTAAPKSADPRISAGCPCW